MPCFRTWVNASVAVEFEAENQDYAFLLSEDPDWLRGAMLENTHRADYHSDDIVEEVPMERCRRGKNQSVHPVDAGFDPEHRG